VATIDEISASRVASNSRIGGLRASFGGQRRPADSATTRRLRSSDATITAWKRDLTGPGFHAISHVHGEFATVGGMPRRRTEKAPRQTNAT
jgi:hypothetical protein